MSRTVQQIYDEIINEKQSLSNLNALLPNSNAYFADLLSALTSNSRVAIWRLLVWVFAYAVWTHEQLWDIFKAEIEDIAASALAGTPRWYYDRVLEFQYGYTLSYVSGKFIYSTIDEAAQIVKYCAIEERADGVVIVKSAKDNSGTPEPLDVAELTALTAYMNDIKFAGTILDVVSFPADQLRIYYEIFYDPILPESTIQDSVESAIEAFIKSLPFNGTFNITKLTDALQLIVGVTDPVFQSADARYGVIPYTPVDREYNSNAGYLEIDPGFPLSVTITYTPIEL